MKRIRKGENNKLKIVQKEHNNKRKRKKKGHRAAARVREARR